MSDYYLLNDAGQPVRCTWDEWLAFMAKGFEMTKRVASDEFDGIHVSTVFLGIDHSFGHGDKPVLYETMIFGGDHDQYQTRYCTVEEALAGHAKAVRIAKGEEQEP